MAAFTVAAPVIARLAAEIRPPHTFKLQLFNRVFPFFEAALHTFESVGFEFIPRQATGRRLLDAYANVELAPECIHD